MMNAKEKECMYYLIHNRTELTDQITRLQKNLEVSEKEHYRTIQQLAIAVKALQFYADTTTWWCCHKSQCAYVDGTVARQALQEIEEVKTSVKSTFAKETLKEMEEVATETIKERRIK